MTAAIQSGGGMKVKHDAYRVTLFKKKLREIIGAPWARFEWSIGRCHLILSRHHMGSENVTHALGRLRSEGIEFIVKRDWLNLYRDLPEPERPIDYISIPVDQEALPERKRPRRPSRRERAKRRE